MNKTSTGFKRYLSTALCFLIGLVLALSLIRLPVFNASAVSSENFVEPTASVDFSNKQFDETSGSEPAAPTGWTGAGVAGDNEGGVVSGVVNLDVDSYHNANKDTDGSSKDIYKLERYAEYKTAVPQTPFGVQAFGGTNKKVLMINNADSEVAYGYTSSSVSFAAASYYRISVYVKTGNFTEGKGATVKLSGLPEEVKFSAINTVSDLEKDPSDGLPILNEKNMYGFKKYTFYIATPLMKSYDVTLSLQVGDKIEDENDEDKTYYNPAKGYAFFDNIEAERISPNAFYTEAPVYGEEDNCIVKDFTENAVYLDDGDIDYMYTGAAEGERNEIGSFERDFAGWTLIDDLDDITSVGSIPAIYNTSGTFSKDNEYNLSERPYSPIGNLEGASNIMLISSSKPVATGFRSPEYTILRNTYYRISYFVNTDGISGGSGATTVIRGTNNVADDDNKLVASTTGLTGDTANAMNYGWKQYAYYIKGSAISDNKISLELWLGQPGSLTSGIAMFDEIKVEKITPSEYASNSSNGTIVTFDSAFEDTGVTNGRFFEVGEYEEYSYPLLPASWTCITPDSVKTTGFSTDAVESTEEVIDGVVSTDIDHFAANRTKYNNVDNPKPASGNLLMISSLKDTAVGYSSPSLTISSSKVYKLTVSMRAAAVTGYGANLVVKSGENVIATIEGIKGTDSGFKTYTFYIEGGSSDYSATLEIWLGLNDRENNKTKLAAGTVFVDRVAFAEATDINYADVAKDYSNMRAAGKTDFSFATYSFGRIDFSAYDTYGKGVVRTPYDWSMAFGASTNTVYGVFDYTALDGSSTEIPPTFENEEGAGNNVLYIRNIAPSYSAITLNNHISLAANSYYSIQVSIKVDIADNLKDSETAVGAGIFLTGAEANFSNIRSTATKEDSVENNETFKTYTFYIKTGDEATDVGVTLTLGDIEHDDQYFAGRAYVNRIAVTDIGNVAYENELEKFDKESEGYDEYIKYNNNVDLSTSDADDDSDSDTDTDGDGSEEEETPASGGELAWWLIPSILFAVAILIAVVGTLIRKLLEKRGDKKSVKVTTSYDRRHTLHKLHNEKSKESEKVADASPSSDDFDEFDDTLPSSEENTQAEIKTEETPEEKTESAETTDSSDSYDEFDDDKNSDSKTESSDTSKDDEVKNGETESAVADSATDKVEADKPNEPADETKSSEKAKPAKEKAKKEVKTTPAPAPKKDGYYDDFED
ncbi:MAG: hypothetical protein HFK09_03510 [Clostridia bacterium]|nr:hypothetical protein [Clostridia bacterium]